jgi:hypothetical protein
LSNSVNEFVPSSTEHRGTSSLQLRHSRDTGLAWRCERPAFAADANGSATWTSHGRYRAAAKTSKALARHSE